jgi:hypothetical protein
VIEETEMTAVSEEHGSAVDVPVEEAVVETTEDIETVEEEAVDDKDAESKNE